MQLEECLNESHALHGKWDLYYHLPHDKQWDLSSYKFIDKDISTLDTLIALNNNIPEKIVKHPCGKMKKIEMGDVSHLR